eukprot:scaffold147_cov113-Cylindrotheca_fusiformis.AAC.7
MPTNKIWSYMQFRMSRIRHFFPMSYSLYSPKSLRDGLVSSELDHASVRFHFWISDGLMFIEAFDSLSFPLWFNMESFLRTSKDHEDQKSKLRCWWITDS